MGQCVTILYSVQYVLAIPVSVCCTGRIGGTVCYYSILYSTLQYVLAIPVSVCEDLLYREDRWDRVDVIWRKMSAVTALENGI